MTQSKTRILIVEDEAEIRRVVRLILQSEGYEVHEAEGLQRGLIEAGTRRPDLLLLDLGLPDGDGLDLVREVREWSQLPIVVLSARGQETIKVQALDAGADDYLTKPFHKDELVARIHAIVRRSKGHAQSVITTGDLVVNLDTKTVEVDSARVHLTGKEYQMLELLSLRKGTTLTKEMFLNHLYGGMDEPELKIIDVFICKLRKKLAEVTGGENYIETVWGRGYVLREPDGAEYMETA